MSPPSKANAGKRKPTVRFMVWAGHRRWARPLCWLVVHVWWPIWRFWAFNIRYRLTTLWWALVGVVYKVLRLGCPEHHKRLIGGHCPTCWSDRLLQNLKVAELRPPR